MRCYQDQTRLAAQPSPFRVLFDGQALYLGVEARQPDCAQILEGLKRDPLRDAAGKLLPQDRDLHGAPLPGAVPPGSWEQPVLPVRGFPGRATATTARGWTRPGTANGSRRSGRTRAGGSRRSRSRRRTSGWRSCRPGSRWRLNLCVNRNAGEASTWAAVGSAFHNPEAFGTADPGGLRGMAGGPGRRARRRRALDKGELGGRGTTAPGCRPSHPTSGGRGATA